jgi:hypothetical protein
VDLLEIRLPKSLFCSFSCSPKNGRLKVHNAKFTKKGMRGIITVQRKSPERGYV